MIPLTFGEHFTQRTNNKKKEISCGGKNTNKTHYQWN